MEYSACTKSENGAVNKMKNKIYPSFGTVPKSKRKIDEIEAKRYP
jgi:hypothetical protein